MALQKLNPHQEKSLIIATVLALFVSVWFLQNYIMLILLSAVVVVLFNPIYHWLLSKGRGPGSAASLTFFISVLCVIIPLIFVSAITVLQVQNLVNTVSSGSYNQNMNEFVDGVVSFVNNGLETLGLSYRLTIESITQAVASGLENFGKVLVDGLFSSISGFFGLITTSIIFIYVFIAMTVKQGTILNTIKKLNPLGDEIGTLYLQRIHAMTKATVRGQFIIAMCQGLASATVLALVGMDDLFFFFLMLLTVMSIVPLGAGIITIPIGVVMILMGNVWQGVAVIANHLIIVTNIDNVLRPMLVPPEARLNSALMILAVFAGLGIFGFFGIVLGPVLMIILVTTLQVYLEVFKSTQSIEHITPKEKKTITRRLKAMFSHPKKSAA
ncbi:MAG: AI-2E family transporter [Candidatus Saccharimonadales bacterium]